jgi:hypothetical protein
VVAVLVLRLAVLLVPPAHLGAEASASDTGCYPHVYRHARGGDFLSDRCAVWVRVWHLAGRYCAVATCHGYDRRICDVLYRRRGCVADRLLRLLPCCGVVVQLTEIMLLGSSLGRANVNGWPVRYFPKRK